AGAMAGPPPHALACEYFAGGATRCDYPDAVRALDPQWQRLACNLLIVAGEALPRGGSLAVSPEPEGVAVTARGAGAGLSTEGGEALALQATADALTSRTVGAYFSGLLAQTLGRRLQVSTI